MYYITFWFKTLISKYHFKHFLKIKFKIEDEGLHESVIQNWNDSILSLFLSFPEMDIHKPQ